MTEIYEVATSQSNDQQRESIDYDSEEALDRLARLTLLSQLDMANFVPEVIAIKKRVKGGYFITLSIRILIQSHICERWVPYHRIYSYPNTFSYAIYWLIQSEAHTGNTSSTTFLMIL